jgi:glycerol-3-phosphate O-acyltransferase
VLKKCSLFSRIINKYWVTSNYVPLQPIVELQLDLNRPIIYVIEQNSASDLLGLQASCVEAGLPDPYLPIEVDGQEISATIYIHRRSWFSHKEPHISDVPYLSQYQILFALHQANPLLDIQLVPVTFYWGRNPGKQGKTSKFDLVDQRLVGTFHKLLIVLKNAKDHLVRFNKPISIARLKKRSEQQNDEQLAHKLAKVAMGYFEHQKRTSIGPKLPNRAEMIDAVLQQESLRKVIVATAEKEQISKYQVEQQCRSYLQEIGADFSYPLLRVFRVLLSWVWNHIYKGIEVNHAQPVRQAIQSGAEIIYMPCHRSHMDYLLLSYLLFEQGLVPPHVAAGVNLNFFPAGPIFRRSGGFFLRRTFKDSPLYAEVFKAYFAMLFQKGYPIEFFTEGGRSRTGRLLPAKVGLLAASLQTYIDQPDRNVMIIPVYIGYDHIMEVSTYMKELTGQKKQKESFWQVLGIIKKLGNFGRAFVNFGEPINIKQYLNQQVPNWQASPIPEAEFKKHVQNVAQQVMVGINAATAVNALPLCASILLACKNFQSDKLAFFKLIEQHQQLLALKSENTLLTFANDKNAEIYQQAINMNKFEQSTDRVFCSKTQATQLSYYRNNIVHVFAGASLLCNVLRYLISNNKPLTDTNIIDHAVQVYPFLQAEYFLNTQQGATSTLEIELLQLQNIGVLKLELGLYHILDNGLMTVLAAHLQETFLRYQQVLALLMENNDNWLDVDHEATISNCKAALIGLSIEPFDDKVIKIFLQTLQIIYPEFVKKEQSETMLDLFTCSF